MEWLLEDLARRMNAFAKTRKHREIVKQALQDAYHHGQNSARADIRRSLGIAEDYSCWENDDI